MLLEGQIVVGQEWSLIFLGTAIARVSRKQLQCEPFHPQCEDVTGISCKQLWPKRVKQYYIIRQPFAPVFQSHF